MEKGKDRAVIVEHLSKNFEITKKQKGLFGSISSLISPTKEQVHALKNVSFSLKKGEMVGFIGPNGAGKTTTLKVLSGLLYPTAGFVQVIGHNPWKRQREFLKKISLVMGQKNQLWWDLPAIDTFELNKAIYEIPNSQYNKTLQELTKLLEVEKLLNIQVRRLSLGQRMRLELLAALLHRPEVLFLDEPTIGLDVVAQQKIRDYIFEYNAKNQSTIILTSHNMNDLVNLVKRLIVIDDGEIVFDGLLRDIINQFAKEKIIKVTLFKETDVKKFEKVGKVKRINYPEVTIIVARESAAVASAEILQNFPIADLTVEEEPIENIIRRVFKGEKVRKDE